ncbi:hypothetical protein U1Q18_050759 [Sarracenia purpurea var. burkii]
MTTSFTFFALILGLILVQTCLAGRRITRTGSRFEYFFDEDPNQHYPTLDCLLFGRNVCIEQCRLKGLLFGVYRTNAFCDQNQICKCQAGKISFYQEWMHKFDADYVYHEILDRETILNQIKSLFNNPFRTAEQFKLLLRPTLSPYQFAQLKVRDSDSLAVKFTPNGQPDIEAIRKHVSQEVDKLSATSRFIFKVVRYKERLLTILENSGKGTLYNIAYRLEQLKNPTLSAILEEHIKENKIDKPEIKIEDKQSLDDVFTNAIVNEIIKRMDLVVKKVMERSFSRTETSPK